MKKLLASLVVLAIHALLMGLCILVFVPLLGWPVGSIVSGSAAMGVLLLIVEAGT